VICLWRRFFAYQEERQEEELDVIARALEEEIDPRDDCPIGCPEVVQVRREFVRDYYRQIAGARHGDATSAAAGGGPVHHARRPYGADSAGLRFLAQLRERQGEQEGRRRTNRLDLRVPASDDESAAEIDPIYLAQ